MSTDNDQKNNLESLNANLENQSLSDFQIRDFQTEWENFHVDPDTIFNRDTFFESSKPDYKYREDEILEEIRTYIDSTYGEHYVHDEANIETGQLILANPERGLGFCIGNVIKYADRYGKKNGFNRKDLLKVVHYAVMALSINTNSK